MWEIQKIRLVGPRSGEATEARLLPNQLHLLRATSLWQTRRGRRCSEETVVPITIGGANVTTRTRTPARRLMLLTSEVDQLVQLGRGPSEKSLHSTMTIEHFTRYRSMGPIMASCSAIIRDFFCMEVTAATVARAAVAVSATAQWEVAGVVVQGPSDRTDASGVQQRSRIEICPALLPAIGDQTKAASYSTRE